MYMCFNVWIVKVKANLCGEQIFVVTIPLIQTLHPLNSKTDHIYESERRWWQRRRRRRTQSCSLKKKVLAHNSLHRLPFRQMRWTNDDFYLIFYYKVVTILIHTFGQLGFTNKLTHECAFSHFERWLCMCSMNLKDGHKDDNTLKIRLLWFATRTLCWSFDFCSISSWLYYIIFVCLMFLSINQKVELFIARHRSYCLVGCFPHATQQNKNWQQLWNASSRQRNVHI